MKHPVKNYFQKIITKKFFGEKGYRKIKFYKNYYKYLAGINYEISDFLNKVIKANDTYFDIGFNCGQYILRLNREHKKSIDIYGFEPVIENYNFLKNKIKGERIHIYNLAINSKSGKVKLYIPVLNKIEIDTQASIDLANRKKYYKDFVIREVESITIDDFCIINNVIKMDYMKIDTEGNDSEVLKGAYNSIKNFKPLIVAEDIDNETEYSLKELAGYKKFYLSEEKEYILTVNQKNDVNTDVKLYIEKFKLDYLKDMGIKIE